VPLCIEAVGDVCRLSLSGGASIGEVDVELGLEFEAGGLGKAELLEDVGDI